MVHYKTEGKVDIRNLQRSSKRGQHREEFVNTKYRWAAQDVPALTEEPYITTMNDYTTQIVFELSSVNIPGQPFQDFSSTWEEVDKELMDHTYFGDLLSSSQSVRKTAEAVVAGATSPHEKMVRTLQLRARSHQVERIVPAGGQSVAQEDFIGGHR